MNKKGSDGGGSGYIDCVGYGGGREDEGNKNFIERRSD